MKRYKLKLKYPGLQDDFVINDIVEYFNERYYVCNRIGAHVYKNNVKNWSEFWEEIKEPLFVTFDGIEIFNENTITYGLNLSNYTYVKHNFITFKTVNNKDYIYFSSEKAAEQWIKENKPKFSEKQILEAIDNSEIDDNHVIYVKGFKKELGL